MADVERRPADDRFSIHLGLEAFALVLAARVLLWRRPTSTVLRVLATKRRTSRTEVDPSSALAAVRRAGALLRAACLPQSVALASLLQRHGAQPEVVLGCRRQGEQTWSAHAWVEIAGQRFEPLVEAEHTELTRLGASTGWEIRP